MAETVTMPKLGFDMAEGVLVRWVVSLGGHINRGEVDVYKRQPFTQPKGVHRKYFHENISNRADFGIIRRINLELYHFVLCNAGTFPVFSCP